MNQDALATDGPRAVPASPANGFTISARPESVARFLWRLWWSRELVAVLARREFFVRFKRASFGVLWAIAVPALQAGVMVVVFSRIVPIRTTVPYITFVFAGMTAWTFFASALATGSTSIVDGVGLASKIYFPRVVLPLVSIGSALYGLTIAVAILVMVDLADTRHIGPEILLLFPGATLLVVLCAGLVLVTSAVHVYFRDVRFLVQAALLVWIYVTPIFYPLGAVHGTLRSLVLANPLTGTVELFRAATVGADTDLLPAVAISAGWSVSLVVVGLMAHCRFDRRFTDLL
jgi:lipopolysaccharide transport system permease protein